MVSVRVACVQFKRGQGAPLIELFGLASQIAPGCDLVVLPEMAATGYVFESPAHVATVAEASDGPTYQALSPIAKAHGCWLVVGYPEVGQGRFYNSALVIDPAGQLRFNYRKTLLYEADKTWASPGDSGYCFFETKNGSFTVGVCMDLNDDGFIEWCVGKRPRVVALPTNWLFEEDSDLWTYWAHRTAPTGAAIAAANTYGSEAHITFAGKSAVLDGWTVLAAAPQTGNAAIVADLGVT